MKKVVIVRHAKSVPYGYDDDFNRELIERGISDASKISLKLKDMGVLPDIVLASPAKRTMQTATIFATSFGYSISHIRKEDDFYEGITTQDFVSLLQKLPDTISTVYVFGHNPTVYYWVYNLVKYFNSDMPTCSTVGLDFQVENWKDVSARGALIAFQITPKSL